MLSFCPLRTVSFYAKSALPLVEILYVRHRHLLDNTVNNITTIYPNSLTTLNSQAHVQSGSLSNSSLHPTTIANSASPSQELKIDNGHEDIAIMRDQLTLRSALAEIAVLRAENSRIAALVNELRDNNIQLLTNTKAMLAEIQSL